MQSVIFNIDNINSLYFTYSKTFFEKLETRVGLRYEHIDYKISENANKRKDSYGTFCLISC
jgi:hypothetical protein